MWWKSVGIAGCCVAVVCHKSAAWLPPHTQARAERDGEVSVALGRAEARYQAEVAELRLALTRAENAKVRVTRCWVCVCVCVCVCVLVPLRGGRCAWRTEAACRCWVC